MTTALYEVVEVLKLYLLQFEVVIMYLFATVGGCIYGTVAGCCVTVIRCGHSSQ